MFLRMAYYFDMMNAACLYVFLTLSINTTQARYFTTIYRKRIPPYMEVDSCKFKEHWPKWYDDYGNYLDK